ncbi:MAG: acyl-CoA thioesterase [Runella sp.]
MFFQRYPDKDYPKEPESRTIIRFQDCDPLQHLNNAKYFDYYFNAREDQVAKLYEFNFGQLFAELRQSWVVFQHQIAYIRPAMVSEWIRITSRLIYFNSDTIVTEYFMTDDTRTQLKNVLWVTSKYIDVNTGKRVPHPTAVMEYLEAICLPHADFHNWNFNERIREIKHSLAPKS